jgi:hypothetical protein
MTVRNRPDDGSPADGVLGRLLDGAIDAAATAVAAFRRWGARADVETPRPESENAPAQKRAPGPPDVPTPPSLAGVLGAALRAGRFAWVALADEQGLPLAETPGADIDFLCGTGSLAVAAIKRVCKNSRSPTANMIYALDGRATFVVTFSASGQELALVAQGADARVGDLSALVRAVPRIVDVLNRAADFSV